MYHLTQADVATLLQSGKLGYVLFERSIRDMVEPEFVQSRHHSSDVAGSLWDRPHSTYRS
ncbi:hypothetical protein C8T65DRAFT_647356 [Cerioporus squamosus]|nr:hypothetical protein C8T65DRAFT_647356 [Cerioporus squamosus]